MTARRVGYGETAEPLLTDIIERTPKVLQDVSADLPKGFSQAVADKILGGLLASARALAAMSER